MAWTRPRVLTALFVSTDPAEGQSKDESRGQSGKGERQDGETLLKKSSCSKKVRASPWRTAAGERALVTSE